MSQTDRFMTCFDVTYLETNHEIDVVDGLVVPKELNCEYVRDEAIN